MVPQALREELGDIIDDPEFGRFMTAKDHSILLRRGWNQDWRQWLDEFKEREGRLPDKAELLQQCNRMKRWSKYNDVIRRGFSTRISFTAWKRAVDAVKEEIAERLAKLAGKKACRCLLGSIPFVSVGIALLDYPARAEEYGGCAAVGLTIFDNIPILDIAVAGSEAIDIYAEERRKAELELEREILRLIDAFKENEECLSCANGDGYNNSNGNGSSAVTSGQGRN